MKRDRVPTLRDAEAASRALREFMRGMICVHPGAGAAFMAGWGQCLRYRLNEDHHDELGGLLGTMEALMEKYSPGELLAAMGEILERSAFEALAGSNSTAACSLHYQSRQVSEVIEAINDIPHDFEN